MSKTGRARLLAALCSAGVTALLASPTAAETLTDAIALAYDTNPTLQAQRASQRATDETYVQARTNFRPTASLQADVSRVETHPAETSIFNPNSTRSGSGATLSVSQPLYTGGQASAALEAADAAVLAGRENLRQVEAGVLQSVIQAYVDVRRDLERVRITSENVAVLQRQREEAAARFEVGEITRTDVAQSEARLAAARAGRTSAEAQLAISRAGYAAVVGQNPTNLEPEPSLAALLPKSVDEAFDIALMQNPALRASDYAEQASRAQLRQAKGQRLPTVSARATLGYDSAQAGWDIPFKDYDMALTTSAVVSVPLFTGGLISSQIRQAAERNNADRIEVEGARRQVLQQVAQSWNALVGSRDNVVSNTEQVRAATIAAEGVRQEQQVGLRTTLDVLNAEQELRNAELSLVSARRDEYVAAAALLSAMGRLEAPNLVQGTVRYDPEASFDKVNSGIGWVPWEPVVHIIDDIGVRDTKERPMDEPVATAR